MEVFRGSEVGCPDGPESAAAVAVWTDVLHIWIAAAR